MVKLFAGKIYPGYRAGAFFMKSNDPSPMLRRAQAHVGMDFGAFFPLNQTSEWLTLMIDDQSALSVRLETSNQENQCVMQSGFVLNSRTGMIALNASANAVFMSQKNMSATAGNDIGFKSINIF
jgi:hypothetical protein